MRFRMVPKSTTLDDPELTLNGCYALCYITHMSVEAMLNEKLNEYKTHTISDKNVAQRSLFLAR